MPNGLPTPAKLGYGSILLRGDGGSPQTFTEVIGIRTPGEIGQARELKEITNLSSPDGSREYIGGMKDGVELQLEGYFLPNHDQQSFDYGLIADMNDERLVDFKLQLTDDFGTIIFSAIVLSWNVQLEANEPIGVSFGIKISGGVSWQSD